MVSKCLDDTLHVHGLNLNLCILRMLENTFLLGAAQIEPAVDHTVFDLITTLCT